MAAAACLQVETSSSAVLDAAVEDACSSASEFGRDRSVAGAAEAASIDGEGRVA